MFLDEDWVPLGSGIHLIGSKTTYLKAMLSTSEPTIDLVIVLEDDGGELVSAPVTLAREGTISPELAVYVAEVVFDQDGSTAKHGPTELEGSSKSYPLTHITVPEEFTGLVQVRPIGKQDGATITSTKLVSYRPMLLRARGIFHEDGSFEAGYLSEDDQGRVYANRDHDNETNPGLSWKPDSQFVEFTAAAVPVDPDMPDSFRVQWSAEDPDDPTNNPGGWNGRPEMADGPGQVVDPNDYDVNGVYDSAEGNDNTGSADDHPTWGQASDLIGEYPISLVSGTGYDDRHAVVHTAFLSGSSKVRFNLTDDGGDNFKVSAVLMDENVPLAESQVAAETGVFTVWKLVDLENVRMNSADDLPLNDVMNAFAGYAFVQFDLDLTRSVENVSPMGFTLAEATVREGDYCSNQEEFTKQFLPGWFFIAGALARVPTSSIEIHAGQATISGEFKIDLAEPLIPGTVGSIDICPGVCLPDSDHFITFAIDESTISVDRKSFELQPLLMHRQSMEESGDDEIDFKFLNLQDYGFPLSSEWQVRVSTPSDTALGVSPSINWKFAGRSIVYTSHHPPDATLIARLVTTMTHELTHGLGLLHRCGFLDVSGQNACLMNWSIDFVFDDNGTPDNWDDDTPIMWSDHSSGDQWCAPHLLAIRQTDLSEVTEGRDLQWPEE